MKLITKIMSVMVVLILSSALLFGQSLNLEKKKIQVKQELSVDAYDGVNPIANPDYSGSDVSYASSDPSRAVLYNNGPMVTHPAGGFGGFDASALQSVTGPMLTLYGVGAQQTAGNSVADDFLVTGTWTLSTMKFYSYQTGSTTTSTITGVYVQVWNGAPNAGGTVVWGDLTTNRLATTTWSSIYRSIESSLLDSNRPIMEVSANVAGCVLAGGTYWVQYQLTGSLTSGPWAPPVSIWGQGETGNAIQLTSTGWAAIVSGTAPATYGQGMPFIIEGTSGGQPNNDLSVISILTPSSGSNLTSAEPVTIRIQNLGLNAQSNFPVSYTLNGGAPVNGTVTATIASLATYDYTFATTANLAALGTYTFHACANLAGDQNAANNCFDKVVENIAPSYCPASTTTEDEYIANVTMGAINNSSGWQGGVADYTAISTTVDPGASQDVVITNGTPWASDMVYIWVDWNKNFEFEGGAELTMLTNVGGTGASFTGAVACPAGTPGGDYRMRIRMTYSTAPTPCGNASYGEVEDYTLVVGGTPTPAIQVSPMVLTQALDPDQIATQIVTVTNTGTAPLTFDLAVNTAMRAYHQNTAEDFARLNARMAADGLGNGLVAIAHGKAGGASTNVSDDETIRYDDGVNFDAIGLTSGGTFQVAAYWPAITMAQYAGMQLQKVEMYINTVPSPCKIKIYGPGTSTTPGALLHEQTVVPTGLAWNLFDLSSSVAITGQDLWIGYEVTHIAGDYPAGCDAGPAVAGYGDMISLDGVAWDPLSGFGLDYNWNLVGYLGGGTTYTNDLGVMTILSPVSAVGLTDEVVTITVKNYGTASQSNIPVSYTIDGGAAVTGVIAGPLAANASVDYTFAGTVNMSNVGQTWVFNACVNLAGDQNAANNCKVASVENIPPFYCDATTTNEDEYIANVTMGTINNTSGWQGGVADYTDQSTTIEAGASQDVVITNGTPWAADIVYIWVDWNMDYTFGTGDEQFMLTNVGGTGASFTGAIAVPAGTPDGDYRMRIRMTYSTAPVPCGNASYGEVEDYTVNVGGIVPPTEWLTAAPLTGTVEAGQSMNISVTFNSAGLANGTYQGSLVFTTNAPATPTVTVPATLTVPTAPPVGIIFEDNFDAYTAGQQVACQNPEDWTTWSNAPCGSEDAYVSSLYAHSGPNSAVIAPNNDLVKMFGVDPITAGKYSISFYAYIPAGKTGYFNTLQKFVPAGTSIWGLEVYFNAAGAGSINATGTATATFTWTPDNWFKVEHIIDIDQDHSEIWIGGNMIYSYQWSLGATGTGQNTLHANDFFGAAATDQFFFDDYVLEDMSGPGPVGPEIAVNPTSVTQNVAVGGTATSTLAISNTGDENLTYNIEVEYTTASAQQAPIDTPEAIAQLTARMAADGIGSGVIRLAHANAGGVSPNTTDDETIRYDDGVNFDAIGLTSGGTFQVAAYWPAATMAQYAGMKLEQVEFYINTVPVPCKIKIYGPGTPTSPGALLHEETVVPAGLSWNTFLLSSEVDITGDDLWIGYEVTHPAGEFPAGCDAGPAVVGYGDMITLDGVVWDPMSTFGLNYNWNLVGYLIPGGPAATNDVGVQTILSPVTGPDLGNEVVTIRVKNFGTASQSNIPVSYTIDGGAAVTGMVAGPLAGGATFDYTFAGTVNMSNVGQTWVFNACTALAGDEVAGNNCKTASVTNVLPVYCDASTTTEDEYIANVTMGMINNSSGWQGGVADYTAIYTEIEAGASQDVVITNGTPWASDITYIWVDWNMNYEFEGGAELTMLTNVGGTGATFTGAVTCPAGQANGSYRMRMRMTYSTAPTPCGNASYGEIEDYTINVGGTPPTAWLTADPLSGTLAPGASAVIDVTFNSNGIPDGDYSGSIVFNSNDPINPVITVPVLFHVGGECPMPAPTNLAYTVTGPTSIHLTWEAPETPGGVIRWDDGVNFDGIGLTSGGTFLVAARWTAAQLVDYVGLSLTSVDLFPRSTLGSSFTLKVWTGANASTLLHSQLITGLTMEQWNTVTLSANVVIPAATEFWIGYEVGAQPAGDFPAGCDAGPAVANYGDMISLDGTSWAPLSGYGLNYNWNIAGTIGGGYDGLPLAQPIVIGQSHNNSGSSIAKGNLQKAANPNWVSMVRDLMGYNVYRDNTKINATIIGVNTLVYNDLNIPAGTHEYYVTAVYPECEAKSNVVTVTTDITEIDNAIATAIYPNPATNFVNIQSGANIGRIMIMNNIGQVVYSTVADSQSIQVNTSDLKKGIYFIQVETIKGMVTEKLIIQ